jgi:hypothetical protein
MRKDDSGTRCKKYIYIQNSRGGIMEEMLFTDSKNKIKITVTKGRGHIEACIWY